jgi:hypothetical protein
MSRTRIIGWLCFALLAAHGCGTVEQSDSEETAAESSATQEALTNQNKSVRPSAEARTRTPASDPRQPLGAAQRTCDRRPFSICSISIAAAATRLPTPPDT